MEAWQRFLSQLEQELGPKAVQEWIPKLARFDAANVYLETRDSFQVHWFEEHVRPRLKGLVNNNGRSIRVHLLAEKKGAPQKETPRSPAFNPSPLDPEMALEHFIQTPENRVVCDVLTEPSPFNPIFLYGPKGAGKTHLLMGMARELQKKGKRVFFAKAEAFTEHVVQAIRSGQMQDFRRAYREIDALIIDDIHIFSRKTATQEEFFHTFNALHTAGRLILLSANVAPAGLSEIEPRLISRFEWGIALGIVRIEQRQILEKKGALWNVALSEELIQFLLQRKEPLVALQALALRSKGTAVTTATAERLLKDLLEKEKSVTLSGEDVVKIVAAHYGITAEDLLGKSQTREHTLPRQVAIYLCRERLKWPLQKIGTLFGRDHSTVLSSVKQIQQRIEEKILDLSPLLEGALR